MEGFGGRDPPAFPRLLLWFFCWGQGRNPINFGDFVLWLGNGEGRCGPVEACD